MSHDDFRVTAVVNWPRRRVHGITEDPEKAKEWMREIYEASGDDPLAASQCADQVRCPWEHRPVDEIRREERRRIAGYLERGGRRMKRTGLLGDEVSGNAWLQAAEAVREESVWTEVDG